MEGIRRLMLPLVSIEVRTREDDECVVLADDEE
jgi:hypothetical protein